MCDATGPCCLLDKRMDDIEVLELLLLTNRVTADHRDRLLDSSGGSIEAWLMLCLGSIIVHLDEPLLHLGDVPSFGCGHLLVVEEEPEIPSGNGGLEHEELVFRGHHRTVPNEPDLGAFEGHRTVVDTRWPRNRANAVKVSLLIHRDEGRHESRVLPGHRRPLLRYDGSDLLGVGTSKIAGDRTEFNEIRGVLGDLENGVSAVVDHALHSQEVYVSQILEPRLL